MKVSALSQNDNSNLKDGFISYSNNYMSSSKSNSFGEKSNLLQKNEVKKDKTMGIETLTIFPKEVINGKTIIIA